MEDLKQNWDLILQTFKERYELQDISFNSWIKPIEVYTVENDTITLIMSSTSMNPDMAVSYVEKNIWRCFALRFVRLWTTNMMSA